MKNLAPIAPSSVSTSCRRVHRASHTRIIHIKPCHRAMNFKKEFEGEAKAIITDAFIFTDFKQGELPDLKFFTHVAAWDTGAEHTSLSM